MPVALWHKALQFRNTTDALHPRMCSSLKRGACSEFISIVPSLSAEQYYCLVHRIDRWGRSPFRDEQLILRITAPSGAGFDRVRR